MFWNWIAVMVVQYYECIESHWTVHFKTAEIIYLCYMNMTIIIFRSFKKLEAHRELGKYDTWQKKINQ